MTIRYHDLNVFHEYWDPLLSGDRTFDIRNDDRGFQRGDIVIYHKLEKGSKTERDSDYRPVQFRIMWILSGGKFGLAAGHVAFSIEPTWDITADDDEGGPVGLSDKVVAPIAINEADPVVHMSDIGILPSPMSLDRAAYEPRKPLTPFETIVYDVMKRVDSFRNNKKH